MQEKGLTRRDVLTKAIPAAAIAGAGLQALAQQVPPPGQQIAPGQQVPPGQQVTPPQAISPQEPGQLMNRMARQVYSNGQYQLPPLPYGVDALEPHISAEIVQIHYDKHHQAYVNNLNQALSKLDEAVRGGNYEQVQLDGLMRDVSFNGGGHMLHSLYWVTMAPPAAAQNVPNGAIAEAIETQFGSFDQFKAFFTRVAVTAKGSGWALLVYESFSDGLGVFQVGDHDLRVVPGTLPILPVDVWEHAYYLQYQNKRADYVNAWWNVVNWPAVTELLTFFRQQNHLAGNMQT